MAETIDLNTLTPQAVASGDKVLGVGSGRIQSLALNKDLTRKEVAA